MEGTNLHSPLTRAQGVAGDSSFSSASRDEQSSACTAGTFEHTSSRPPPSPPHTHAKPAWSMPTGSSPPGVYRYCLRAHRLRAFFFIASGLIASGRSFLLPPGSSPPGTCLSRGCYASHRKHSSTLTQQIPGVWLRARVSWCLRTRRRID